MNIPSVLTVLGVVICLCYGKLPSDIKICSRNDPNIAKCIIDSIRNIQPKLASGNLAPDFKVTPLEPLKLENIHIDRGPGFQIYISDLVVTRGASKFDIDKMRVNLNEPTFEFLISLPRLEYKGKYDLKVILGVVPATSAGDIIGIADDYRARVRLIGKKYPGPDGKPYVRFEKIQLKIMAGKSKVELKNLFKDNPALQLIGNAVVSENSQSFLNDLIPSLEKSLANIAMKSANDIVKKASFDEIFPDI